MEPVLNFWPVTHPTRKSLSWAGDPTTRYELPDIKHIARSSKLRLIDSNMYTWMDLNFGDISIETVYILVY